jgi:hypothetical protein
MIEHAEALGLEQRCVEPGHWLIEGYDCYRENSRTWRIWFDGSAAAICGSLRECREWIRDQRRYCS